MNKMRSFVLKYKNLPIGIFSETRNGLTYNPIRDNADSLPHKLGYPYGLFELDMNVRPWRTDKNKPASESKIRKWLSDRVFSEGRSDLRRLLDEIGLDSYDVWEIAKKTNAVTNHDFYTIEELGSNKFGSSVNKGSISGPTMISAHIGAVDYIR